MPSLIATRLGVRGKLLSAFAVVFLGVAILGIVLLSLGSSMNQEGASIGNTYLPAVHAIGDLHLAVAEVQRDQYQYLAASDTTTREAAAASVTEAIGEASDAFATLDAMALPSAQVQQGAAAKATWTTYLNQTANVSLATGDTDTAAALALMNGDANATMDTLDGQLDDWTDGVVGASDVAASSSSSTAALLIPIVGAGVGLIIVIGWGLALVMSRSVVGRMRRLRDQMRNLTGSVGTITSCLEALADNDLSRPYTGGVPVLGDLGSDEIGQMATSSAELHEKIKVMAGAYETARRNLTATVGDVKLAAQSVAHTSGDLNNAATQTGSATAQISQTINQVASGASEQARAASDTADAAIRLGDTIGQVGGGAAETTVKVDLAAAALDDMTKAIGSATAASAEVVVVAGAAATAAENGRDAVRQTVTEMERIRQTVVTAASKVTELGAKSDQIGAIVETIDDIAEQTNLLALNAAIEAARAGEQGKGFAVVADEVRKLAERSSRATREIADLIGEVQSGTDQAVQAMQAGAAEVEQGSRLAGQAGASLDEIATAVEATMGALMRITGSVESMSNASSGVVAASDAIATIAAQTNKASHEMTSSSDMVSRSVQAIAAISEENSASAEEVSAATEELSAQAEEVVASAESLATMASNLNQLVARFKLESGQSEPLPLRPAQAATGRPAKQTRAA